MDTNGLAKVFEKFRLLLQQRENDIRLVAANAVLASFLERIFEKGKATDGSTIGKYSKKEIWIKVPIDGVSNANFEKIGKPKKKKGDTEKKAYPTKETMYFPSGYKEFKEKSGRKSNKVNLYLTGDLFLSVKLGQTADKTVIGIVSQEEKEKAEGNEKRFGKAIFELSNDEKQLYFRTVNKEIEKLIKQIFS